MSKSQKSDGEGRKGIKGLGNSRNSVDGWAEGLLNSDQGGRGLELLQVHLASQCVPPITTAHVDQGRARIGTRVLVGIRVAVESRGLGSPSTSTRGASDATWRARG